MGKGRLLLHVFESQPGTVQAQARPGDAAVPYAPAARMLRAVIARVPDALDKNSRADLARVLPEVIAGMPSMGKAKKAESNAPISEPASSARLPGAVDLIRGLFAR